MLSVSQRWRLRLWVRRQGYAAARRAGRCRCLRVASGRHRAVAVLLLRITRSPTWVRIAKASGALRAKRDKVKDILLQCLARAAQRGAPVPHQHRLAFSVATRNLQGLFEGRADRLRHRARWRAWWGL